MTKLSKIQTLKDKDVRSIIPMDQIMRGAQKEDIFSLKKEEEKSS